MTNFASSLDFHAHRKPNKVVVTDGDQTRTNSELLDRVKILAASLEDAGIGPGDLVALLMYNRVEFIELVYAVNRIGAAFLPLNYRLAPAEWQYILQHSEAKAIFTETEFVDALDSFSDEIPSLVFRASVDSVAGTGWNSYAELVAASGRRVEEVAHVDENSLQRLMYTSGTTSRPKGVRITHRNVTWKNIALLVQFGWTSADITMVAGPLYHVGALDMGGLTTLYAGGSLVLQRKFAADPLLGLIEQHRPSNIWLAPAMVNAVLESTDLANRDLSSLQVILSGGEKMPEARLQTVLELMPDVWFADAYGLTETVSSDTFVDKARMHDKLGSVGRPVLHQELRIVDEEGVAVPAGEVGEIVLRGPKVFDGYWKDPEATEQAIRGGWFHTGDIGRLDNDGYLYIEDRKKDMIVSGGENIASPEIERALYEHPDVVEAAVVASAHPRWGEVPHAYVVLREGATTTPQDIETFCEQRLARFKVPRLIDLIGELPRTPSGKVLKRELRALKPQEGRP